MVRKQVGSVTTRKLIKAFCVSRQNCRLVLFRQARVFAYLIDLMDNIARTDLVREIAREEKMLVSDALDLVGEAFLPAFATNKNAVTLEIIAGLLLDAGSLVFSARNELPRSKLRGIRKA